MTAHGRIKCHTAADWLAIRELDLNHGGSCWAIERDLEDAAIHGLADEQEACAATCCGSWVPQDAIQIHVAALCHPRRGVGDVHGDHVAGGDLERRHRVQVSMSRIAMHLFAHACQEEGGSR